MGRIPPSRARAYAAPADLARREHGTYCISRDLMIRYSVLDLAPITQGSDAATALRNSRDHGARVRSYEIVAGVRV